MIGSPPAANRRSRRPAVRHLRTVAAACCLALLVGCAGWSPKDEAGGTRENLAGSLQVAAAALGAGQHEVARRLYLSLAERFPDAPEPALGVGYVELYGGNPVSAKTRFLEASVLAGSDPATKAEALLAAGRAALAAGRTALAAGGATEAQELFAQARAAGPDTAAAPWIANGHAVAAALDAQFMESEGFFAEALRLSPDEPRITANLVRMLITSGRVEEGARLHAAYDSSHWEDGDGPALLRLIEDTRRRGPAVAVAGRGAGPAYTPPAPSGAGGSEPGSPRLRSPALEMRLSAFAPPPRVFAAAARAAPGRPGLARTS